MKKDLTLFLILFCSIIVNAQQPAGVENALIWLRPNANGEWEDLGLQKNEEFLNNKIAKDTLNYNWVPSFTTNEKVVVPVLKNLERATYIVVFQPTNNKEKAIFHFLRSDDKLSTKYFYTKDNSYKYLSKPSDKAQIVSYVSLQETNKAESDSIFLANSWMGIDPFSGILAEFIVFDRVLTKLEREKIETYLSLKYAIPLDKDISLVAPNDEILWEKSEGQRYGNQVFGFGVDSLGSYRQTISLGESSKDFVVQLNNTNPNDFLDGNYILWSSTENDYIFKKSQTSSDRYILEKSWAFAKIGNNSLSVDLEISTKEWSGIYPKDNTLWLMQSSTENAGAKFLKPIKKEQDSYFFSNVPIDDDKSGKDFFSFVLGGEMIFGAEVLEPSCIKPNEVGKIILEVFGGEVPFNLVLSNGEIEENFVLESREIEIPITKSGFYQLRLTDKLGNKSEESLNISYKDGPQVNVNPFYTLNHLGKLEFDFSTNPNKYTYSWFKEAEFIKNGNYITIKEPAFYNLEVQDENSCKAKYGFLVDKFSVENMDDFFLYPNPVRVGEEFSLVFDLEDKTDLEATLYDSSRRIIEKQKQSANYGHFNFKVNTTGVYFVVVEGIETEKSYKVIVR